MIVVRHRVCTRRALDETDPALGVEVYVRAHKDRLVAASEAFAEGELFEWWLESYRHRMLIVRLCETGLEHAALAQVKARGIEHYLLCGPDRPSILRTTAAGEGRCAVRVSDYEAASGALALAGRAGWVWLEGIDGLPPREDLLALREAGFQICVASPETLDPRRSAEIELCVAHLKDQPIDAVCTAWPGAWLA